MPFHLKASETFYSTLNSWIREFVGSFFWCHEQVIALSKWKQWWLLTQVDSGFTIQIKRIRKNHKKIRPWTLKREFAVEETLFVFFFLADSCLSILSSKEDLHFLTVFWLFVTAGCALHHFTVLVFFNFYSALIPILRLH